MAKISEEGAARRLRTFFKGVTGDFASKKKIFENEGRDLARPADANWFYNWTSTLNKNGLATPKKESNKDGVLVTTGLILTDKGRAAVRAVQTESKEVRPEVSQPVTEIAAPVVPAREMAAADIVAMILSEVETYNASASSYEIVIDDVHIRRKGALMN